MALFVVGFGLVSAASGMIVVGLQPRSNSRRSCTDATIGWLRPLAVESAAGTLAAQAVS